MQLFLRIILVSLLSIVTSISWFAICILVHASYISKVPKEIIRGIERDFVGFYGDASVLRTGENHEQKIPGPVLAKMREIFSSLMTTTLHNTHPDRFRIVIERFQAPGESPHWGPIVAAEYVVGKKKHQIVRFVNKNGNASYYSPDGRILGKNLFISPIRQSKISSGFQYSRFHPLLRLFRPHLGVDLAATLGTPVVAVADGVVVEARRKRDAGRLVVLSHRSNLQTRYLHLSRFANKIRPGVKVRKGETIGYVGMTGLATRPHLHFELRSSGVAVDPENYQLLTAESINASDKIRFVSESKKLIALLP